MVTVVTELENYVLEHEIGRGDLTVVYQGRRKSDGTVVAVKVAPPQFSNDEFTERRFRDITRHITKVEHKNIAYTYEVSQEGDTLFIVRDLVDACPLSTVIAEEGPFSPYRMLAIARQIASALDYAHQKSIVHGNLSAKRVYLGPDDHVTVADFGQRQAWNSVSLIKSEGSPSSREILAPECVRGQGPSRQSDLYSLGILCYQMLAGDLPSKGQASELPYEPPRRLHLVNQSISLPLSETICRMLSKDVDLRYATGAEFIRALTVAIEGSAPVRISKGLAPLNETETSSRPFFHRKWFWGIVAVLIAILLLIAGFEVVSTLLA